jgi:predicted amidophosphoribosyltransferase
MSNTQIEVSDEKVQTTEITCKYCNKFKEFHAVVCPNCGRHLDSSILEYNNKKPSWKKWKVAEKEIIE